MEGVLSLSFVIVKEYTVPTEVSAAVTRLVPALLILFTSNRRAAGTVVVTVTVDVTPLIIIVSMLFTETPASSSTLRFTQLDWVTNIVPVLRYLLPDESLNSEPDGILNSCVAVIYSLPLDGAADNLRKPT